MSKPAAIIRRLDAALATMAERKMEPRAIYLLPADHEALARVATKRWRSETGSTAAVWPCSYGDTIIVNDKGVEKLGVPVRETKNRSLIYSTHGVAVAVPKRAPL